MTVYYSEDSGRLNGKKFLIYAMGTPGEKHSGDFPVPLKTYNIETIINSPNLWLPPIKIISPCLIK